MNKNTTNNNVPNNIDSEALNAKANELFDYFDKLYKEMIEAFNSNKYLDLRRNTYTN